MSRATSPRPEPKQIQPRIWQRHPYLAGALIASPISALYGAFHKPINKFACKVGGYLGRVGKNVFTSVINTPFNVDSDNDNGRVNKESEHTTATKSRTPNPTPKVSSGNKKYDEIHQNTLNNKNY